MSRPILSVLVPVYNEEEVIDESYRQLTDTLSALVIEYELIFINDGSRDASGEKLHGFQEKDPHVRVIDFARNFGHQPAIAAGLNYATGQAIVIIDADLQDPPGLIPDMLAKWRQGYDVVYGKRLEREGESFFKKFTAFAFYRLLNFMSGYPIPKDTGDFRLMDSKVADVLRQMPEHNMFLRGMVSWVGFKQTPIEYHREKRQAGTTKYPLKAMLRLATNGIFSFSAKPLQAITLFGMLMLSGALLALVIMLITMIFGAQYTTAGFGVLSVFGVGGILLLAMGVQGAYLHRIYDEAKGRPVYIVAGAYGFPEERD